MVHPLLKRQLDRIGLTEGTPTAAAWRQFEESVSRTYTEADEDRYTLERSMAISSAEMQQLYENIAAEKLVLEAITADATLADILDTIVRVVEERSDGMTCSVLLLDRDGTHLRHGAAPGLPEAYVRAVDGIAIGPSVGSCGTAAYRKEAVIVTDIASDPLWAEFRDLALSHGLQACWSTPILASNHDVLGTFAMYYREPRAPQRQDLKLMESATHLAAIAIERARAEDTLGKLSSAVEQASESVLITDRHGVIEYVNPAFERLTGYVMEDLIGKTPRMLNSGEHDDRFYQELWETLLDGRDFRAEFTNRKKNGEVFYEEKVLRPIRDAQGTVTHFVSTGRDISERKRSEAALNREAATTRLLQSAIRAANEAPTLEVALQTVLNMTCESIGWPVGHAYLTAAGDSQQEVASVNAWHLRQPDVMQRFVTSSNALRFKPGQGLPGRVLATRQPLWIPDLAQWPSFIRAEAATEAGLRSGFAVPVMASFEVVGVLEFFSTEPAAEDVSLLELATHLGTGLGRVVERARAVEVLSQSEEQHRSVAEAVRDIIYSLSTDGTFLSLNPAFETLTGWPRSEWIGKPFAPILHHDDLPAAMDLFVRALAGEQPPIAEMRVLTKDGGMIVGEINASPVRKDGAIVGVMGVARDITERKKAEETIRHLAYHDGLTDLPNRALFNDRLTTALAQAGRGPRAAGVIFIDLDNFKLVNDSVGHSQGDELLRSVAGDLAKLMRKGDTLARVGGDEFAVLIPWARRGEDVVKFAQRLLRCITRPRVLGGREFRVTGSVGIALYPTDGKDADALMRSADIAMYRAKALGKNNCQLFDEQMNAEVLDRMALEEELRRALDRGEFVLHYQPIANVESGRITSAEALIRWEHPERGLIPPLEFIPFAEETGLILPIGEWVLRTACAQGRRWQDAGLSVDRVAVNISVLQFLQPDFVETVRRILTETGLEPSRLELEVTESVAMEDTQWSQQVLGALDAMGIRITIDDFGTGHSSLAYLKAFPIMTLKIDRTFVRDVTTDADDAAIAVTIIGLARTLGLSVIAEGVETDEQLAFLRDHGCDEFQGFFLGRPGCAAGVEELAERWTGEHADKGQIRVAGSAKGGSTVLQTARREQAV